MLPIVNQTGITIKQLKELLKDLPEKDQYGEDFEVWIQNPDGQSSNPAKTIMKLNHGDLIFSIGG